MSDKNKSDNSNISNRVSCMDESGRGLPHTATSTPMPTVQPTKLVETSEKANKSLNADT